LPGGMGARATPAIRGLAAAQAPCEALADGRTRAGAKAMAAPTLRQCPAAPLHLIEEAGRRALGSKIIEVLVVAERDDLPAVDGADPGAVARNGVVIEDDDGPGAIGLDADADIVHRGGVLDDDVGRPLAGLRSCEDAVGHVARHDAVAEDDVRPVA